MRQFLKSIIFACSLSLLAHGAAVAADRATAQEATEMIKKVIAFYKANGPEKTYAAVNDPKGQFIYKDLYVFAGSVKPGGVTFAHGGNPKLLGKPLGELRDGDGVFFVKKINDVAASKEGKGWVDYRWPNPVTKALEQKSTYVERVDDVYFACGIYK